MRRMMIAFGIAASGALLVSGCQFGGSGGGDGAKPSAKEGQGQVARTAAAPRSSTGPAVSKQVTLPVPGKQGQTATLGFAGLKVKGQLATLTLVWTPHMTGSDKYTIDDMRGDPSLGGGTMSMIDTANLKRYVVVQDEGYHELAPDAHTIETGNNQPLTANYTFAAPPANASMDVYLEDNKVFDAVPVTR